MLWMMVSASGRSILAYCSADLTGLTLIFEAARFSHKHHLPAGLVCENPYSVCRRTWVWNLTNRRRSLSNPRRTWIWPEWLGWIKVAHVNKLLHPSILKQCVLRKQWCCLVPCLSGECGIDSEPACIAEASGLAPGESSPSTRALRVYVCLK